MGSISEAHPNAIRYLNRLVTRDVAKLRPGRVAYTVWCDDHGKVLDDGTLFRLIDSEFHIRLDTRLTGIWTLTNSKSRLALRVSRSETLEAWSARVVQLLTEGHASVSDDARELKSCRLSIALTRA